MGEPSVKRFICSHAGCGMVFSRPSRLKHHELIHTGVRPYLCEEDGCMKSYTRAAHLKRHIEHSHVKKEDSEAIGEINSTCSKVQCSDCSNEYSCGSSLRKHRKVSHSEELQYKCGEYGCGQAFRKKKQLRAHVYEHRGVLPFQCHEAGCLQKYAQKSHLDRHLKVHQGYKCPADDCNESFNKFTLLRKHQSLCHRKEHICPACKRSFRRLSWLKSHQMTHSDTRDLVKCPKEGCTRSYLDVKNLRAHIKSYHEGRTFACTNDDCKRTFVTKQKLQDHEKLHSPSAVLPKKKRKGHSKGGARRQNIVTKLTGVPEDKLASMTIHVSMETDEVSSRDVCCDDSTVVDQNSSIIDNSSSSNDVDGCNNHTRKDMDNAEMCNSDLEIKNPVLHFQTTRMEQLYGHSEEPSTSLF